MEIPARRGAAERKLRRASCSQSTHTACLRKLALRLGSGGNLVVHDKLAGAWEDIDHRSLASFRVGLGCCATIQPRVALFQYDRRVICEGYVKTIWNQ
jgi:hypothetical protein